MHEAPIIKHDITILEIIMYDHRDNYRGIYVYL